MDTQPISKHRKRQERRALLDLDAAGLVAMPAAEVAALKAKLASQDGLVAALKAEITASVTAAADACTALKAIADLLAQRDAAVAVLSRDLVETRAELEKALAAAAKAKAKADAREAEHAREAERAIEAAWNNELPADEHAEAEVKAWPQEQEKQKRPRGSRGSGRERKRLKEEYRAWLLQNPWWTYG